MNQPRYLPQCDRCRNYSRSLYMPCAIHPLGLAAEIETCPDFESAPRELVDEWWEPEGASFYGDDLVITPVQRFTREQQLAILDTHPLFTGRCPHCEMPLLQTDPPRVHWDCEHCGWMDDSI